MNGVMEKTKVRKMALQMLGGAVAGAVSIFLFLKLGENAVDFDDPARIGAAAIGMVYVLMGAVVGLGVMAPGVGAAVLNVEDAGEIIEQRKTFVPSVIVCVLTGLMLMVLSLTPGEGSSGALSREVGLAISVVALGLIVLLSIMMRRGIDEFNRQMGIESSAMAMHVSMILFGGWGALAHLGYVEWIQPLGLLAALATIQLLAMFWIVGRRGLLAPR